MKQRNPVADCGFPRPARLAATLVVAAIVLLDGATLRADGGDANWRSPVPAMHLAELDLRRDRQAVAQIDRDGVLHFYIGAGQRRDHTAAPVRNAALVGGGMIRLINERHSEFPLAYTIGAQGEILEIRGG